MLSETASLGLINLIPGIGIMKNYKVTETSQNVDEHRSGCLSCRHFITCENHTSMNCTSCKNKVYQVENHTRYINEKNKYGEKKSLKRNALLLLIYLHFLHPDSHGLVHVNVKEAAEAVHCDERSIRNNIRHLERHEYISAGSGMYPGSYQIFIRSYDTYFNSADQGGRGFIKMTAATFEGLAEEKNITALRLSLRLMTASVSKDTSGLLHHECTYHDFKAMLPAYCCRNIIQKAMQSEVFKKFYQVAEKTRYSIYIDIADSCNPAKIRNTIISDARDRIRSCVDTINTKAAKLGIRHGFHWDVSFQSIQDISNIALQYDCSSILRSMERIYSDFVCNRRKIDNLGALVRTYTRSDVEFMSLEA